MSIDDEQYADAVMAAREQPYHERVSLERNARGELAGVEPIAGDGGEEPAELPEPETVEPQEEPAAQELTPEQRLEALEQFLGPVAIEAQRQAQLEAYQQLVEQVNGPRDEVLAGIGRALGAAAAERFGTAPDALTLPQRVAQAEAIVAEQVGGREAWDALAPQVAEHMAKHADTYDELVRDANPAQLAQTLMGTAALLQQGELVKTATAQAAASKQAAMTMSGGSVRPATMTDDEQYAQRIRDAAKSGGYGS